jgi:uncharacterized coiled-coil DUF342 family protein
LISNDEVVELTNKIKEKEEENQKLIKKNSELLLKSNEINSLQEKINELEEALTYQPVTEVIKEKEVIPKDYEEIKQKNKQIESYYNKIKEELEGLKQKKEEYYNDYTRTLEELKKEREKVSYFMNNNQNFQLTKKASELINKMKTFINDMSDLDYFSDLNELPDGTRQEYIRAIYGVYKWGRSILNEVDYKNVVGINPEIIDVTDFEGGI